MFVMFVRVNGSNRKKGFTFLGALSFGIVHFEF